jgi:hypothetical protein
MSLRNLFTWGIKLFMNIFNVITNVFHWHDEHDKKPVIDKSRRVLFILKKRQNYDDKNFPMSMVTGMYNSVSFISDMLNSFGIVSSVVVVIDNNFIDREVTNFKPTDVFIEGIWVVAEKFDVLKKLHPEVNWIVRCHSEIPFLAHEGTAMERLFGYVKRGVAISGNNTRVNDTFRSIVGDAFILNQKGKDQLIPFFPNYYPTINSVPFDKKQYKKVLNVGCFGAIRPLKNQLIQAIAAIELAKKSGKGLNFHINVGRVEGNASGQLRNLTTLFNELGDNFNLVEHSWMSHVEFCDLLTTMDVCMQVSFTETFNIVTADAVSRYVPVVVSEEISWVSPACYADTTDVKSMVDVMERVIEEGFSLAKHNVYRLNAFSEGSKNIWLKYFYKK